MANDFDPVAKIIEYWLFENDLNAAKAGNNLTASAGGVGYNSGAPLEGSYSLDLEADSNQWAFRTDANLSAGFPLKNGDTTKKLTWCFWLKPESILPSASRVIISKYKALSGDRSLQVMHFDGGLSLNWGYNSGNSLLSWDTGQTLGAGSIYHIGLVVDGIAQTAFFRVWNGTTATTYTKNDWGQELWVGDADFVIGNNASYGTGTDYDGLIDEVVIANDLLSATEIDAIRQGIFNQANPAEVNVQPSMQFVSIAGNYCYQPFIIF